MLRAAIDDDLRMTRAGPGMTAARPFRWSDPVPSRAVMDARALLDQPVGAACRQGIRRLGEHLFGIVDSIEAMREVLERVADREPERFGRRLAIVDSAWNGIGSGADVWAS